MTLYYMKCRGVLASQGVAIWFFALLGRRQQQWQAQAARGAREWESDTRHRCLA